MKEKENKSKNKAPNVVGTYEAKRGRWTHRFDFLENGVVEGYRNIKEGNVVAGGIPRIGSRMMAVLKLSGI